MKTLYLLRHAKSSWDNPGMSDFDRPLNERGRKSVPFMGAIIEKHHFLPDSVLSSPAMRSNQTATLLKESADLEADIKFDERIYEASPETLQNIISETKGTVESLMIVGHNPGFEGLVKLLTGEIQIIPTAALVVIDLEINNWNEVEPACGRLRSLIRPKAETKSN